MLKIRFNRFQPVPHSEWASRLRKAHEDRRQAERDELATRMAMVDNVTHSAASQFGREVVDGGIRVWDVGDVENGKAQLFGEWWDFQDIDLAVDAQPSGIHYL